MRPTSSRWSGLFALLLACGPSPGEPIEEADEPATIAEACADLFAQLVAHDERCTGQPPAASEAAAHIDSCVAIVEAPGSALTIADVSACAGRLADRVCDAYEVHPECLGAGGDLLYPNHERPGTRPPGAACMAEVQCTSGYCSAWGSDCGQCQRLRVRGESCSEPFDLCVGGDCVAGVCDLFGAKLGEECVDYGESCQRDLYCRRNDPDGIAGICTARGVAGEPCDAQRECVDGLYCGADGCTERVADGGACPVEPDGCASGFCVDGLCGRPAAGLTEGADCTSGYCRPALSCTDNVCRVPDGEPIGGSCFDTECAPGLHCDKACTDDCSGPGVCADMPQPGEPCTIFAMCAPGVECVGFASDDDPRGTCVRRGLAGEACPCGPQLVCIAGACNPVDPGVCG